MGNRLRCCLSGSCVIFSDGFARADSTDLGSDWTEISGDWAISSGDLIHSSGSAGDKVLGVPANGWSKRAWAQTVFNVSGSPPWEFGIIVGSNSSATSYKVVTVKLEAAQCTITAGSQSRQFDQDTESGEKPEQWVYPSDPTAETWTATCCYTANMLYVALEQQGGPFGACVWDIEVPLLSGINGHAGLMWNSGTIMWEGFTYNAHHHDDVLYGTGGEDVNCPDCTCSCGTFGDDNFGYPPWKIRTDIGGGTASCSCFDGSVCYFEPVKCNHELETAEDWWLCTTGSVCGHDASYHGFGMAITCGFGKWTEWELRANFCEAYEYMDLYNDATCSPFELNWLFSYVDSTTGCSWCSGDDSDTWIVTATDGTA